ncbi:MAG: hypothetical protein ACE5IY_10800 [bacterium]
MLRPIINTLRDPGHPRHVANRRLYHADEVRQSLKKMLTALASGQEAVSLQPVLGPVEHSREMWQDAGLLDARVWQATGDLRQARKPVYYASKQLIDALLGADRPVEIFDLGPNVFTLPREFGGNSVPRANQDLQHRGTAHSHTG